MPTDDLESGPEVLAIRVQEDTGAGGGNEEVPPPFFVAITAYRLTCTGTLLGLGIPKAVAASHSQPAANTLDWVISTVVALAMFWVGYLENTKLARFGWFFRHDLTIYFLFAAIVLIVPLLYSVHSQPFSSLNDLAKHKALSNSLSNGALVPSIVFASYWILQLPLRVPSESSNLPYAVVNLITVVEFLVAITLIVTANILINFLTTYAQDKIRHFLLLISQTNGGSSYASRAQHALRTAGREDAWDDAGLRKSLENASLSASLFLFTFMVFGAIFYVSR